MKHGPLVILLAGALCAGAAASASAQADYANDVDKAPGDKFEKRGHASKLIGYERYTERAADAIVVLPNPSDQPVSETVLVPDSKLMDGTRMVNLLADGSEQANPADLSLHAALMEVTLPAHGFVVLGPDVAPPRGYANYKRVQ